MPYDSWFEPVRGSEVIYQGDYLYECCVPILVSDLPETPNEDLVPDFDLEFVDAIVLSQTCDLENNNVESVLLAQLLDWDELIKAEAEAGGNQLASLMKKLGAGEVINLFLFPERTTEPRVSWKVVDFRKLHTLPKSYVQNKALAMGDRLRVASPYREALSQAFARFHMRVALDEPLIKFHEEKKIRKPAAVTTARGLTPKMLPP